MVNSFNASDYNIINIDNNLINLENDIENDDQYHIRDELLVGDDIGDDIYMYFSDDAALLFIQGMLLYHVVRNYRLDDEI